VLLVFISVFQFSFVVDFGGLLFNWGDCLMGRLRVRNVVLGFLGFKLLLKV